MAPLPTLTPEQREHALAAAKEARRLRSEALAKLRTGQLTITAAFTDNTSPLWEAKVRQVLLAVPGVGKVKADTLLADLGIKETRRVKGLGSNQRTKLVAALTAA
jgi:hypothetical protein